MREAIGQIDHLLVSLDHDLPRFNSAAIAPVGV
jgi:hypothetical protein